MGREPMIFTEMSDRALLRAYANLMRELRRREIVTSSNNPVGDVAERLAARVFGLDLAEKSKKGLDGVDTAGVRYQVKGRRLTPENASTELSVVRNLADRHFDYLVAIYFDEEFEIHEAVKVAHDAVARHTTFDKHRNGHRFVMKQALRRDPGCLDVTAVVRTAWGASQ